MSGISFQARLNRDVEPRAADADIVSVCKSPKLMLNSYLIVNYLAYLIKNNYAFSYTTSTSKLFSDGKIDLSTLSIGNIRATRLQKQCRKCKQCM